MTEQLTNEKVQSSKARLATFFFNPSPNEMAQESINYGMSINDLIFDSVVLTKLFAIFTIN